MGAEEADDDGIDAEEADAAEGFELTTEKRVSGGALLAAVEPPCWLAYDDREP